MRADSVAGAPGRFWFGGAAIYSLAVSVVLLISLIPAEGAGVGLVLAVPVVLSALPVLLGPQRIVVWGCIGLLTGFVLIGAASIGLFYLPALVMLAIGARQMARA
ncbi:hypothetical protein KOI35_13700 [Actinoplanes bogorensis]|uniref:Uncharacterized protein n=1 Tax=Paractinoplanes bogorensis TaxID=1610840 RepID=A0ABS5YM87_9ACTN|nr:hypothetical protein [Actinoplanes bogorensis]MBU2664552.1 hypothetical protein [Actinoplanes bogorensis]